MWANGCQRVFSHAYVCVCIHVSGDTGKQQPFRLQTSLPLHIVLKLLSAASLSFSLFFTLSFLSSVSLTLSWRLSLAHCCVTISHHRSPERDGREPTSWGVAGCLCVCLETSSSSSYTSVHSFCGLVFHVSVCVCGRQW